MSERDPQVTLSQIKDAAERAQLICKENTFEELLGDWKAIAALERFLEIIGEGVNRLPTRIHHQHPEIPWRAIAGLRNRLIHGYDSVDYKVLWNTAEQDIPDLISKLEKILSDFKDPT